MSNEELIAEARSVGQQRKHLGRGDLMLRLADALEAQSAPLVADSREALANALGVALANAYDDDSVVTVEECVADTLLASGVVSLAADRDRAEDPYCRAEDCQYLNWTSGSIPTHKRGSTCPNPYRESEARND